jgi:hypothetical protein
VYVSGFDATVVVCANGKLQAGGSFPVATTAVVDLGTAVAVADTAGPFDPTGVFVSQTIVAVASAVCGPANDLMVKNNGMSRMIPITPKISNKPFRLRVCFMAPPDEFRCTKIGLSCFPPFVRLYTLQHAAC